MKIEDKYPNAKIIHIPNPKNHDICLLCGDTLFGTVKKHRRFCHQTHRTFYQYYEKKNISHQEIVEKFQNKNNVQSSK